MLALRALLAEFGVLLRPASGAAADLDAWVGQLIDWTRRCWPAAPYRPEQWQEAVWQHAPRMGDDAIFSVTLDLATLLGDIAIDAYPAWRWGLDMSAASLRGPMLTSRRVVMTTAPLGSKGIRPLQDWEATVVMRYQQPTHFLFKGPLSTDAWATQLKNACSGREVQHFEQI